MLLNKVYVLLISVQVHVLPIEILKLLIMIQIHIPLLKIYALIISVQVHLLKITTNEYIS